MESGFPGCGFRNRKIYAPHHSVEQIYNFGKADLWPPVKAEVLNHVSGRPSDLSS